MGTESFIAEIGTFAGNFAPQNWHDCDGALLPISQYQALFSLLGVMYGGDGRTNFAVPDLRERDASGQPIPFDVSLNQGKPRKCISMTGVYPQRP
jgi:microcystin-dependent protein